MPHNLTRLMRAAASGCWFIEPRKAAQLMAVVEMRMKAGPGAFDDSAPESVDPVRIEAAHPQGTQAGGKMVRIISLHGTILPRAGMMDALSGAVSMVGFQKVFREAADDPNTSAIILDIDSPGGQVDLVPETVALIRSRKRADRPIIAVANTLAASAAYWLAIAADELVVTPSGSVGSIGVYMMHQDISERLVMEGIAPTFIYEGPRKVEGNPYEPLDAEARNALQAEVRMFYDMFTRDVAKGRGVPLSVVQADPESADRHFGGGRCYPAREAVRLGMADRVATLDDTITRAARGGRPRKASIERRRLALI